MTVAIRANMQRRRGNRTRRKKDMLASRGTIIPGLPDEVALSILARLPRYLRARRRLICHAWKDAMEPARITSLRKALNISEEWPVFISMRAYVSKSHQFLFTIVDPLCRRRHRHNISLPHELHLHMDRGAHLKFTVIGAIGSEVLIAATPTRASEKGLELQGVYSFDGLSMRWGGSKYSSLPHSLLPYLQDSFASAVDMDRGYFYVAGGYGWQQGLQGVQRLDIKTRMWEALPDPHVKRERAVGVVLQGLFYMIGGMYGHTPTTPKRSQVHNSGEIWDPACREWTLVPELWPFEVFGVSFEKTRVVTLMDRLYALRRLLMTEELMYYENDSKSWMSLGHVPLDLSSMLCTVRLLGMGQELWVVDYGNMACVATKPTISQPISWRTLPPTFKRALPIYWCSRIAVLQV